jgi:NADH-quinone oxidoreductase subunit A
MQQAVIPIFLFLFCVAGLAGLLLAVANLVNPGRSDRVKQMPYESGMDPVHDTRRRFTVRFHLLAIAFLVFDVELLFLYPWAVAMHRAPEGAATVAAGVPMPLPPGIDAAVATHAVESRGLVFAGAMCFLLLLALGFLYDWRKGVFRWR